MEVSGLTQAAVAIRLGVSQGTVSAWVNGAIPQPRTARALADTLGVTTEWLLYGTGDKLPIGRTERHIKGTFVREIFDPPLSEKLTWPRSGGLDRAALGEIAARLNEAAAALRSCAKIMAKSAGKKRGNPKRPI